MSGLKQLRNLRRRLARLRIFDPVCGSGNFLVIAYKELRKIEREINTRLGEPQDDIAFRDEGTEIYLCGNPPYYGGQWQSAEQKADMREVFAAHTKKSAGRGRGLAEFES